MFYFVCVLEMQGNYGLMVPFEIKNIFVANSIYVRHLWDFWGENHMGTLQKYKLANLQRMYSFVMHKLLWYYFVIKAKAEFDSWHWKTRHYGSVNS